MAPMAAQVIAKGLLKVRPEATMEVAAKLFPKSNCPVAVRTSGVMYPIPKPNFAPSNTRPVALIVSLVFFLSYSMCSSINVFTADATPYSALIASTIGLLGTNGKEVIYLWLSL